MRNECLNYKHIFESDHPISRLINKVAESFILFIIRILNKNISLFKETLWCRIISYRI